VFGAIVPGSDLGSYRIVEKVGQGGMAAVYKAYQASLSRFVAIKVLPAQLAADPDFQTRFREEVVAAGCETGGDGVCCSPALRPPGPGVTWPARR